MQTKLRVLFFKEGEVWVGQCLEYDFAVQAETVPEAQRAMGLAFLSHVFSCKKLGLKPFANVPAAPDYFHREYEKRAAELAPQATPPPPKFKKSVPVAPPYEARVA